MANASDPRPTCRHCGERPANRPRGLCFQCYYLPGVRRLYPTTSKYSPTGEPTAEEVERCVAEQSRPENLPTWWWDENCQPRD